MAKAKVVKGKMNKVKPSAVETATISAPVGISAGECAQRAQPLKLFTVYQIESLLTEYLSDCRKYSRGPSLIHFENARLQFQAACESLHLATLQTRQL